MRRPRPDLRGRGMLAGALLTAALLGMFFVSAGAAAAPKGARRAVAQRASRSVLWGISDDSPGVFVDPRFRWLGMRIARVVMAWDVMYRPAELAQREVWLDAARVDGVRPLVVFAVDPKHSKWLPTPGVYARAVGRFLRKHPWIRDYTPWDEENHYVQPTSHNPRRAAQYFNLLSAACRSCAVTAADVLDEPNMERWLGQFLRYAHHPRVWGLHNYLDLNHGGHRQTKRFLQMVPGLVWFTETGGLVWRYERSSRKWVVRGDAYAARAAARLGELAKLSKRITRVYYYQWRVPYTLGWAKRHRNELTWDSGLIGPECVARTAFYVVARQVGRNPWHAPRTKRDGAGECVSATPLLRAGAGAMPAGG